MGENVAEGNSEEKETEFGELAEKRIKANECVRRDALMQESVFNKPSDGMRTQH